MRLASFYYSLPRADDFRTERFACERFCSLSTKAVNHSELFPMARRFGLLWLTEMFQRVFSDTLSMAEPTVRLAANFAFWREGWAGELPPFFGGV
jgi:hypothetical protein